MNCRTDQSQERTAYYYYYYSNRSVGLGLAIYSRDCRIINNDRFYVHISTEVSVVVLLEHVAQILPGEQCNWAS